jgi:hypothetical protein
MTVSHFRSASRSLLMGLAIAAISSPITARTSPAGVLPRGNADVASRAFDDAQFRGDVAAMERFLAPTFLYVRGSGRVGGRSEFIANFTDPTQHFEPFVITDRRVIPLGPDSAIVAADGVISGVAAGKPFTEHFRFVDTFLRRAGRWQVVYVQVTPIP